MADAIDLATVLGSFAEPWRPRNVAALNDYDIRVVKTHGEFTEHAHPETDEMFLVLSGRLVDPAHLIGDRRRSCVPFTESSRRDRSS